MQIESKVHRIARVEKAEVLAEVPSINLAAQKQESQNQSWVQRVTAANNNILQK